MPPNTPIFLLGLAFGTSLLMIGLTFGYWFGRKAAVPADENLDRDQFLSFLRNLSSWTTEFSGDVSNYQSRLIKLNDRVLGGATPAREEVVELLAQFISANERLQERLESAEHKLDSQTTQISSYLTEARTDGLTGLLNRRAFDKATDKLFVDWNSQGKAFSLGLIDIDHFKRINDTHGHPAGDAVLKCVAHLLQTELTDAVCVARYGGEEFALLALGSAEETASTLENLRQKIESFEFNHEEKVIQVTLSAGVSLITDHDKIGNLVRRADEALYAAKLGGRNRVYLHDGTICRLMTDLKPDAHRDADAASITQSGQASDLGDQREQRVQERLKRIVLDESQRLAPR